MTGPATQLRFVLAGAALAMTATACSAQPGSSSPHGTGLTAPAITQSALPVSYSAAEAALVLSEYIDPNGQSLALKARSILVAQCMHTNGFPDYTAQVYQTPTSASLVDTGGPYGYLDAGNATTYGFHSPDAAMTGGAQLTIPAGGDHPAQSRQVGQCTTTVQAKLTKDYQAAGSMLPDSLWDEAATATLTDPRVEAADALWAGCLKSAGFSAANPTALARSYLNTAAAKTSAEYSAASADVSCTKSTNLAGVYFAVLDGYQQEAVDANSQQLTAVKAAIDAEGVYAEKLIAANG